MATKPDSLTLLLALFLGGLGMAGTGLALLMDISVLDTSAPSALSGSYIMRDDLGELAPSPRFRDRSAESLPTIDRRSSDPLAAAAPLPPVRIVIGSIGVDATISAVGLEPTDDEKTTVAVPRRTDAGWYKHGSAPGQPGAVVVAGHVDLGGQTGVFWNLDALPVGELIEIYMSDGSVAKYRALRATEFDRYALPSDELFRRQGDPALHLITCGGAFNQNLRRYESNLVITAVPINEPAGEQA